MLRRLATAWLLVLACAGGASAQVLDDALAPAGRLRLDLNPVFTTWEARFGRTATGETGREQLGEDLTTDAAHTLYPGAEALRTAIASMAGLPGYTPVLGETVARVNQDITRVDFGAYLGVFDWLTIGAVLPWTRTRANVDVAFVADTLGGDLGLSPVYANGAGVASFLGALSSAEASALAYAAQTCASMPGSASCASAQDLADRTAAFRGSAETAYDASAFFPFVGSATATVLSQATAALDADLMAAGLPGIGAPMIFATERVNEEDFLRLPTTLASGLAFAEPLGSVRGIWQAGDVEVSATIRLLGSGPREPEEPRPSVTFSLLATLLGRLPTGQVDDPDIFYDVGAGDGQADLEGRLRGAITIGDRIGVLGGARYGIQLSRTLVRRVAPPEMVLAPVSTRQLVEWQPGSYWGLELAPGYRFSDELSIAAEYRVFRKYRDEYALTGPSVGAPVDPTVLQVESGMTLHEIGGTLRYDTVARVLGGEGGWPLQLHARFLRAVAGGGGQTPVTTRAEFGVRFFRRIWGSR
ncbi:MAG TPA: hypothetical protein VMM35_06725 [Longimicrobiales bacterium]|nr:hypothetical protein [Longimicrobiales bacterium]